MGQLLSPPGPRAAHLCIDMQRLFEPGAPWATPWMDRVLPRIIKLAQHAPERTVFSRFIPPRSKHDARGIWRAYYEKWECVTRERLDPELIELVPALAACVPPAAIVDRPIYNAFGNGRLQAHLDAHGIDTVIVSGGETDVCVLATVLAAIDIGYRVIVAEDALCSSSDQSHDALLQLYAERFSIQIEVASTADILRMWTLDD
ncbi:Nicotinamidase-related amidase [Bradyrhizobium brasilense]|uniref:Nicotinamidase-related amidase n=1 Tax=Bradyrhizobium brasilense TaxID=1419277 RepID=A0A1G7A9T4_9BRAD|nr:cysteine hydrolase [Bradyrhizobium brasilense]SDE11443.1 Nicotinamidase-related amidase [Bradyrhizobium brasilense]